MLKLDTIANVATAGAAAVMVGVLAWNQFRSPPTGPPPPRTPATYAPGDRVDGLPQDALDGRDLTVVLAVSSHCRYCTESMPFYRSLVESVGKSRNRVRLVAVSREPLTQLDDYLHQHAVRVDASYSARTGLAKIAATPTLLVLDKTGTVTAVWIGRLTESQQSDVFKALGLA